MLKWNRIKIIKQIAIRKASLLDNPSDEFPPVASVKLSWLYYYHGFS